eukprot:TRINITY_DN4659_c0_g1_i2.p1 TRINITY_DN4659_c0_g1~~TRINITY_DN4659_c0_g1_i2.p1  ORF type:complete len:1245 (-),score=465.79 TRINITY_DN4659_c0_g1_i2:266-3967(-)
MQQQNEDKYPLEGEVWESKGDLPSSIGIGSSLYTQAGQQNQIELEDDDFLELEMIQDSKLGSAFNSRSQNHNEKHKITSSLSSLSSSSSSHGWTKRGNGGGGSRRKELMDSSDEEEAQEGENKQSLSRYTGNGKEIVRQAMEDEGEDTEEEYEMVLLSCVKGKRKVVQFRQTMLFGKKQAPPAHKFHLKFKFQNTASKLLKRTLEENGFTEVRGSDWCLLWSTNHVKPYLLKALNRHQKINHFPRSYELTRKDKLYVNLSRMQQLHGKKHYNFVPQSYMLPAEQSQFEYHCMRHPNAPWIVKPISSSRGRGIYLIDHFLQAPASDTCIVSKYINNPLLIDGFKFDLRIYVAVTNLDPLRIYLFREGLVRFASEPYDPSTDNLDDAYMHLTNYSVNKFNENFVQNKDADEDNVGNKWSISALFNLLGMRGIDTVAIWDDIKDIVVKTIVSSEHTMLSAMNMFVPHRNNCFELYGFDVLIDENFKSWLLEVNLSPALSCDSPLDAKIKSRLVSDLFTLVGFDAVPQKQFRKEAAKPQTLKSLYSSSSRPSSKPSSRTKNMNSNNVERRRKQVASGEQRTELNAADKRMIRDSEDELQRRGAFELIYPVESSFKYTGLFEEPRRFNEILIERAIIKAEKARQQAEEEDETNLYYSDKDDDEDDDGSGSSRRGGGGDKRKGFEIRHHRHTRGTNNKGMSRSSSSAGNGNGGPSETRLQYDKPWRTNAKKVKRKDKQEDKESNDNQSRYGRSRPSTSAGIRPSGTSKTNENVFGGRKNKPRPTTSSTGNRRKTRPVSDAGTENSKIKRSRSKKESASEGSDKEQNKSVLRLEDGGERLLRKTNSRNRKDEMDSLGVNIGQTLEAFNKLSGEQQTGGHGLNVELMRPSQSKKAFSAYLRRLRDKLLTVGLERLRIQLEQMPGEMEGDPQALERVVIDETRRHLSSQLSTIDRFISGTSDLILNSGVTSSGVEGISDERWGHRFDLSPGGTQSLEFFTMDGYDARYLDVNNSIDLMADDDEEDSGWGDSELDVIDRCTELANKLELYIEKFTQAGWKDSMKERRALENRTDAEEEFEQTREEMMTELERKAGSIARLNEEQFELMLYHVDDHDLEQLLSSFSRSGEASQLFSLRNQTSFRAAEATAKLLFNSNENKSINGMESRQQQQGIGIESSPSRWAKDEMQEVNDAIADLYLSSSVSGRKGVGHHKTSSGVPFPPLPHPEGTKVMGEKRTGQRFFE